MGNLNLLLIGGFLKSLFLRRILLHYIYADIMLTDTSRRALNRETRSVFTPQRHSERLVPLGASRFLNSQIEMGPVRQWVGGILGGF